jgi:hypothetical protein
MFVSLSFLRPFLRHLRHLRRSVVVVVVAVAVVVPNVGAQATVRPDSAKPSPCWRFAFGEWKPPLDWNAAGHKGTDSASADQIRKIRDSVYDKDPVATRNNAMEIQYTKDGMQVMLYPFWWPPGVRLTFDSTVAGGREMVGTAVALVANGAAESPRARTRAQQTTCAR